MDRGDVEGRRVLSENSFCNACERSCFVQCAIKTAEIVVTWTRVNFVDRKMFFFIASLRLGCPLD